MTILENIHEPSDLRPLSEHECVQLAREIREFLISNVSRTGGHLGPNLGVVELTIALHRIFSSPRDALVFDTGHQAYVHKLLTGRQDFSLLRHEGGLSGYPSRKESKHDIVENSHATTSLSWADGIARAFQLTGQKERRAVAIIGDGALTGGMAWEALNNIAEDPDRPIVVVLNDNGRSYAPTVGGMIRRFEPVRKLDNLRVNRHYENFLDWGKQTLADAGAPGKMAYGALHSLKQGVKDIFFDAGIFDSLGLKYIGPVNGHHLGELEEAFTLAKDFGGPVVVHVITEKGRGYRPAETDDKDHFHAIGKIHPETGLPVVEARFGWTSVFAEEILALAKERHDIVGVTAAMLRPVGLGPLSEEFPSRVIDVGIAEQHAVTMAAGLASQGMHPVVALYATFMNRAFDQMLMDVALHGESVTFMLDRAGITGDDGASHNGMWDLNLATIVPHMHVAAPRDGQNLRRLLRESINIDGPSLIRYPKGSLPQDIPAIEQVAGMEILARTNIEGVDSRIALVAVGTFAHEACEAISLYQQELEKMTGHWHAIASNIDVIDPLWVCPMEEKGEYLSHYDAVVTLEDGLKFGGVGSYISSYLDPMVPVWNLGVPQEFLTHRVRADILADYALDAQGISSMLVHIMRQVAGNR